MYAHRHKKCIDEHPNNPVNHDLKPTLNRFCRKLVNYLPASMEASWFTGKACTTPPGGVEALSSTGARAPGSGQVGLNPLEKTILMCAIRLRRGGRALVLWLTPGQQNSPVTSGNPCEALCVERSSGYDDDDYRSNEAGPAYEEARDLRRVPKAPMAVIRFVYFTHLNSVLMKYRLDLNSSRVSTLRSVAR